MHRNAGNIAGLAIEDSPCQRPSLNRNQETRPGSSHTLKLLPIPRQQTKGVFLVFYAVRHHKA